MNIRKVLVMTSFRFFLSLAPVFLTLFLTACDKPDAPQVPPGGGPPKPLSVKFVTAQPVTVPEIIEVIAHAEGAREVEVRARVQGILKKRTFEEGNVVRAGQVLFEIERTPYEIALNQAKAAATQAEAQIRQGEAAVAAATSQVTQTTSSWQLASRELVRLQALIKDQIVSRREVDAAETTVQTTAALVQTAEAAVKAAHAIQATAQAGKLVAQTRIAEAELNLSYAKVVAPVDGITGRAIKSEGALVTPLDGLLTTLAQTDPIWVNFSFSESDLARIPGGKNPRKAIQKVRIILADGTEYAEYGKLNFAASAFVSSN